MAHLILKPGWAILKFTGKAFRKDRLQLLNTNQNCCYSQNFFFIKEASILFWKIFRGLTQAYLSLWNNHSYLEWTLMSVCPERAISIVSSSVSSPQEQRKHLTALVLSLSILLGCPFSTYPSSLGFCPPTPHSFSPLTTHLNYPEAPSNLLPPLELLPV